MRQNAPHLNREADQARLRHANKPPIAPPRWLGWGLLSGSVVAMLEAVGILIPHPSTPTQHAAAVCTPPPSATTSLAQQLGDAFGFALAMVLLFGGLAGIVAVAMQWHYWGVLCRTSAKAVGVTSPHDSPYEQARWLRRVLRERQALAPKTADSSKAGEVLLTALLSAVGLGVSALMKVGNGAVGNGAQAAADFFGLALLVSGVAAIVILVVLSAGFVIRAVTAWYAESIHRQIATALATGPSKPAARPDIPRPSVEDQAAPEGPPHDGE